MTTPVQARNDLRRARELLLDIWVAFQGTDDPAGVLGEVEDYLREEEVIDAASPAKRH